MTTPITPLDPASLPSINDPTNFNTEAQTFVQQTLPNMVTELNVAFQALNLVSTNSTSSTSNSIGTGAKTYTVDTGKSYVAGMFVMVADTAAPTTNYNFGQVTSYNSGTGALVIAVTNTKGSGTKTAWTISQSSAGGFTSSDLQNQVATKATTTGTGSAYVLAVSPALSTYTNALVKAVLHADPSGSPTININGLGAKNFKYFDANGAKQFVTTTQAKSGHLAEVEYDGTDAILLNPLVPYSISGTVQATTSGTSKTFTSIPSWAKTIILQFSGVSTNGTSILLVQLGDSGGIETTGYVSTGTSVSGAGATTSSTAGFILSGNNAAAYSTSGNLIISKINGNEWVASGLFSQTTTQTMFCGGTKTLSDVLDRLTLTTVNGTDTFDAGSINIIYG